jgi:hypothetical protein
MEIDDYGTPNTSMPWSVFPVIVDSAFRYQLDG